MSELEGEPVTTPPQGLGSSSCSQCGGPGALPVRESDLAALGDVHQIITVSNAYGGGGAIAVVGLRVAQRFAMQSLRGLAFCSSCRNDTKKVGNPFLLPKVCAGLGFLFGLTLMGAPIAFLLYGASFISLRRRLRAYRQHPTASALRHALDAVGTLTIGFLSTVLLLAVMGGVIVYMVYLKR
jgi:hypothetical protein